MKKQSKPLKKEILSSTSSGQESIVSKQFKIMRKETSKTSKTLQEELNKAGTTIRSQWEVIKSHSI